MVDKYLIIKYPNNFHLVEFAGMYKTSYENSSEKDSYYKIVTASQLRKIVESEKKIEKLNKEIQEEIKKLFEKGEKLK